MWSDFKLKKVVKLIYYTYKYSLETSVYNKISSSCFVIIIIWLSNGYIPS